MDIVLPQTLQELYQLFSNPLVAAVFFSMVLEQLPQIQDTKVENWKKVLGVLVVAELWAIGVALFAPGGFVFSAQSVYAVIVSGFALAFSMNVWNKLVEQGLPWLRDLLVTLFGKRIAAG